MGATYREAKRKHEIALFALTSKTPKGKPYETFSADFIEKVKTLRLAKKALFQWTPKGVIYTRLKTGKGKTMQIITAAIVECSKPMCDRVITVPIEGKMDEAAAKSLVTRRLAAKEWGVVTIKVGSNTVVKHLCKSCALQLLRQYEPPTEEQIARRKKSGEKRAAAIQARKAATPTS